jgi:hypothetical protein
VNGLSRAGSYVASTLTPKAKVRVLIFSAGFCFIELWNERECKVNE